MEDEPEDPDPELYRLRMRAEIGAESPLWTDSGTLVDLDQLRLTPELQEALGLWADQLWDHLHDPSAEWQARGKTLHARLVEELGPDYEVVLDGP